jgi:hypothetical protein
MAEVTDLADADRLARKLARIKAKRARVVAEFKAAAAKADARLAKWEQYTEERLQRHLARTIEADEDGDPMEPATIELPCGVKLGYRPNPVGKKRLVIKDEAALIDWARKAHPDAIETVTVIRPTEVRLLLEGGKPVEGAYLADPDWSVYQVSIPKALLSAEADDEAEGA